MTSFRFLPLLVIAVLAGAFGWRLMQMEAVPAMSGAYVDPMLNKPMPALELPLLSGEGALRLGDLQGTPYLLNVFASWCAACQMEHPLLQRLASEQGLPLYGMAWKDKPENTKTWLEKMGNPYTAIGTDMSGEAAIALGLTGAPETYLVSADGQILALYRGGLSESVIENRFVPAIAALRKEQRP